MQKMTKDEREFYDHLVATTDKARLPAGWTPENRATFLIEILQAGRELRRAGCS